MGEERRWIEEEWPIARWQMAISERTKKTKATKEIDGTHNHHIHNENKTTVKWVKKVK